MNVRKPSADLQKKARAELYENPGRIGEDINHIKNWLAKQPHIKARKDDQWLLAFLRGCKFSLERTKEKLDLFYTMRSCLPEFFENRDPMRPEIQAILKLGLFLPLPKPNQNGERIILIRLGGFDTSQIQAADIFKTYTLIVDILVNEDDNFIIAGVNGIVDMRSGSLEHYTHFSPTLIKKIMKCLQTAYPVRPKGLFFINAPSFFEMVHNLFKSFLTEKLRERMKVYTDCVLDVDAVPQSMLPSDYGGDAESVQEITNKWKKKVESYRDWFLDDAQYGVSDNNRQRKQEILETFEGTEGSFRKLDID